MKQIAISTPSFDENEYESITKPLDSGWITQGPFVAKFENEFAAKHMVNSAIATTSCTTALHLMLIAGGIKPGDEVIVPSFTWVATANVVLYCGAKPVFVDINLSDFNINLEKLQEKITEKTRAIIVVHLFGQCVDVKKLRSSIPDHIKIFEDAACAVGASVDGIMAGSMGDAAAFSFHPRKIITTGEGGMLTTNDPEISELAKILRNHGAEISEEERHNGPAPYILPEFRLLGFNYRMTDFQGALGSAQLQKLEMFLQERDKIADFYTTTLKDLDWLQLPRPSEKFRHSWQSYVTLVDPSRGIEFKKKLMSELHSRGVSTRPGTHAIHLLEFYKAEYRFEPEDFPNSLVANNFSVALPMHNKMTMEDQERVVAAVRKIK